MSRPIPLSICTGFFQFSSLEYRVWWTGFFSQLDIFSSSNFWSGGFTIATAVNQRDGKRENFISVHFDYDIFNYPNPTKWISQTGILDFANLMFQTGKKSSFSNSIFQTGELEKPSADRQGDYFDSLPGSQCNNSFWPCTLYNYFTNNKNSSRAEISELFWDWLKQQKFEIFIPLALSRLSSQSQNSVRGDTKWSRL